MSAARAAALWTCPTCGRGYVAPADAQPSCAGTPSDGSAPTPHPRAALVRGRALATKRAPTGKFPGGAGAA